MRRTLYEAEHEAFRETVRTFLAKEVVPYAAEWDRAGVVPRVLFAAAGAQGLPGMAVPEEFGGGGVPDFRFNAVLGEEVMRAGVAGPGAGALSGQRRVTRIYGGTTVIMKEVIGRELGL